LNLNVKILSLYVGDGGFDDPGSSVALSREHQEEETLGKADPLTGGMRES